MEKIFDAWSKRFPKFETRYEDTIVKKYCDYGRGNNQYNAVRGVTFGAGYEIYIIAFFIGLYADKRKKLTDDSKKKKDFGMALCDWGHIANRNGREAYHRIQNYMFAACVARTDIDFIALDKDEIKLSKVVDQLIDTMQEYANFGFDFITEKMEDNPDYFFKDTAFLNIFMSFTQQSSADDDNDDKPEEL